ncbi:cytochrome P450 [Armillaria fumosa]|nr:cytochrome P450 [Armillaria fumosa]
MAYHSKPLDLQSVPIVFFAQSVAIDMYCASGGWRLSAIISRRATTWNNTGIRRPVRMSEQIVQKDSASLLYSKRASRNERLFDNPCYSCHLSPTLLYPDIQAKAQVEIDTIVRNDRLPRFDHREHLPYVNALASSEDDVQSSYFITRGSVVLENIWYEDLHPNMLHDPAVYDKPFKFKPERLIRMEGKEPEMNPHKVAFGFGRRHPSPFKCAINPRSEKVFELVDAGFE